jgi:hypothetical protein
MRTLLIPPWYAMACVIGIALPATAIAQSPTEPSVVLQLSASGVRSLNQEFDDDFQALDAFGGARRDRFLRPIEPTPKHWMLYGRLGLINFQNEIKEEGQTGTRFSLRRSGPKLTGKIYIGIHRRF